MAYSFKEFQEEMKERQRQRMENAQNGRRSEAVDEFRNSEHGNKQYWRDGLNRINVTNLTTGETRRNETRSLGRDNFLADIGQSVGGALQRQGANYKSAGATLLLGAADLLNGKKEYQPKVGSWLWRLSEGAEADTNAANRMLEDAKHGYGKAYGLVMDLTSGAVDLASDALLTAATGGATVGGKLAITAGLGAMGARSFGSGAMEAADKGMSRGQQFVYGLKSAGIEMLTEKIGGPFEKAYGKTALGGLTRGLADSLGKNAGMRFALNALGNFTSEGAEEVLSDILNPLADKILKLDNGEGWQNLWTKEGFSQMAYDGLVGGILGLLGGAAEGLSGAAKSKFISDNIDNAILASQQGKSLAAELEQDADGTIAQAISNQASQEAVPEQIDSTPTEIAPEAPNEVKQEAEQFNAEPEAEPTPKRQRGMGKKTAKQIAWDAWFGDNVRQDAEPEGVSVDASDFNDEASTEPEKSDTIEPARTVQSTDTVTVYENGDPSKPKTFNGKDYKLNKQWPFLGKKVGDTVSMLGKTYTIASVEEAKSGADILAKKATEKTEVKAQTPEERIAEVKNKALAQNGIDYGYDPRNSLDKEQYDDGTWDYKEYDPYDFGKDKNGKEFWSDYQRDLRQARLLDAVDKEIDFVMDAKYGTLEEKLARLQRNLNRLVDERVSQYADADAGENIDAVEEEEDRAEKILQERNRFGTYKTKNKARATLVGNTGDAKRGIDGYLVWNVEDAEGHVSTQIAEDEKEAIQKHEAERSNDEAKNSADLKREGDYVQHPGDGSGVGGQTDRSSEAASRPSDSENVGEYNFRERPELTAKYKETLDAHFGNGATIVDVNPDSWRWSVSNIAEQISGVPVYWVNQGQNAVASGLYSNRCIFLARTSFWTSSKPLALAAAMHEVIHERIDSLVFGGLDGLSSGERAHSFVEEIFKRASLTQSEIEQLRVFYGAEYLLGEDERLKFDELDDDEQKTLIYELLKDKRCLGTVDKEIASRAVSGEVEEVFFSLSKANYFQKKAREYASELELVDKDTFSYFPTASEYRAAKHYAAKRQRAFLKSKVSPSPDSLNNTQAKLETAGKPVADNAKEYAYQKKLEAQQNSEEAQAEAKSNEEKAQSTFGKNYEKVQQSAKDFADIKTFADEEDFLESDKKRDKATRTKLEKFRTLYQTAVETGDVEALFDYYDSLADDPDLGNFFNEQVKEEIDNFRKLSDQSLDTYNEGAIPYAASRTVRMMAHKFKLANEYQQTLKKMNETLSGSKNGMLRKIAKSEKLTASVARALVRWQINPDTVFKMVDSFDKGNMGEGYKLAKELQDAHRKKYEVKRQALNRFNEAASMDGYEDFWRGKQKVTDYNGKEWDMRSALSVIKAIDTIRSTSGKKLGGTSGFGVMDAKGNIEYIDMKDVDATKLYESLKSGLSDVAIKYGDAATEAYGDVKEPLRAKFYDNNGIEIGMVGDIDENVSENAKSKKGYEKAVYSPLSYVTKNGDIYQFDIAKQDTYNNVPRFLRERSEDGGTYILIKPYTDVVDGYFEQVSNYLAYSTYGEKMRGLAKGSSYTHSLGTALSEAFGKDMGNWYQNYVEDLKTYKSEEDTEGINTLLREGRQKLQQGALLFSVSVPMKQISSYWAASGILHPDSLMKAYRIKLLKPKNGSDAATMLASRAMGNLEQSASEAAKDAEKWLGKLKYSSRFIKFAANAINQMDYNTVSNLLSATEYDVLKYQFNNDTSKVGTDEYKAAVEQLFQDVVDRSQPNFDKQMRAEYGRTDNEIVRMLSMFRTQQTQNLNLLATAIGEYKASKGTANQAKATETLKQTIAGQAASAFSLSALTILADMLLHRQRKYEDEEKEIDMTKVMSRLGINAIEAASGTLWFGDTVAKWAIDQLSGGETNEFYGVNLGVVTTVQNAIDAVGSVIQSPTRSNVKYAAGQISTMFGIPLNNAYAFLNSAIMYAKDVMGTNEGDYDDILRYIDAQAKAAKKEKEKAAKAEAKAAEKSGADLLAETASKNASQSELNSQEATEKAPVSGYLTKPYNALVEAGMSSQRSQEVLTQMDTDSNNSVKQAEMIAYWKAHPEDEQYVIAMWNSYGYKTTWEKAKQKAG